MRTERRYGLIAAVLLSVLYSCTPGQAADAKVFPPVGEPEIVAPETADAGTLVVIEAAAPEDAKLAWAIIPPTADKCFAVDTSGKVAYFACPRKGRYTFVLACAVGDKIYALTHTLTQGDAPDPGPDPGPDPPDPNQKYQIMLFQEGNDLDNYTRDQVIMVASLKFREELEKQGHRFLRALDLNSIQADKTLGSDLKPWYRAAKDCDTPCVGVSPVEGGQDIIIHPLPKTLDEFYELIGGKP